MVLRHVRPKADWRGHADIMWTVAVYCAVCLDGMANKPVSKHAILAVFGMGQFRWRAQFFDLAP